MRVLKLTRRRVIRILLAIIGLILASICILFLVMVSAFRQYAEECGGGFALGPGYADSLPYTTRIYETHLSGNVEDQNWNPVANAEIVLHVREAEVICPKRKTIKEFIMHSDQNGVFTLAEPVQIGWHYDHEWGTNTSVEIIAVNVAGCESKPIRGDYYWSSRYDDVATDEAFEDLYVRVRCEQPETE